MRTALDADVRELLRCPACGCPLAGDTELRCTGTPCGASYPVAQGVPVLIDESRSVFSAAEMRGAGPSAFDDSGQPAWRRAVSARIPQLDAHLASIAQLRRLRELVPSEPGRIPRVLVVGGAILGPGLSVLTDDPTVQVVESDVFPGPRVQVMFDGHDVPFPDESFDAVIAQGVLEHVLDPYRCATEMARVTRTGGLVYAETPFMQQVHGGAHDFTRFSHLGHRRLFRPYEEVASGISIGAGSVVAWSWKYLLVSACRTSRQRTLAHLLARLTGFGWKWLDRPMAANPGAYAGASEFFFLGRKVGDGWLLPDRELLVGYRGLA